MTLTWKAGVAQGASGTYRIVPKTVGYAVRFNNFLLGHAATIEAGQRLAEASEGVHHPRKNIFEKMFEEKLPGDR